jgi:hypothetical protein
MPPSNGRQDTALWWLWHANCTGSSSDCLKKLEKQAASLVRKGTNEALADVAWRVELLKHLYAQNTPLSLDDLKALSTSARVQRRVPQERGFLPECKRWVRCVRRVATMQNPVLTRNVMGNDLIITENFLGE